MHICTVTHINLHTKIDPLIWNMRNTSKVNTSLLRVLLSGLENVENPLLNVVVSDQLVVFCSPSRTWWPRRSAWWFCSATGCCTPTASCPSLGWTSWNRTCRCWRWYQAPPSSTWPRPSSRSPAAFWPRAAAVTDTGGRESAHWPSVDQSGAPHLHQSSSTRSLNSSKSRV